jgi:hypothetical protein
MKCGLKIYEVDQRECQGCAHFKDMGAHQIPICTHHMMGVTRTMHVTYAIKDGTCFSLNHNPPDAKRSA